MRETAKQIYLYTTFVSIFRIAEEREVVLSSLKK